MTGPASTTALPEPPRRSLPDAALAAYPHIANCPGCRQYIREWSGFVPRPNVIAALLAYHDSSHTFDPLTSVTQHFAIDS